MAHDDEGHPEAADFLVLPALDVLDGRCVRLSQGRREAVTIDGGDPVAAAAGGVPVQVGGGLRTAEAVEAALDAGAARTIVGSAALAPGLGELIGFGERLVVAIDARDGRVVADGWTTETAVGPAELAHRCARAGVRRLLVTSTRRDGSLAGPDLPLLEEVL